MAAQEVLEDPPETTNCKKWTLKVSIHCEGCKRKVKKILNQVEGVYETDVDAKQQKVTVIGNVDANTLLKKLMKSGKHAELWPEKPDQNENKSSKSKNKEKMTAQETSTEEPSQGSVKNIKNISVTEVKPPPVKVEAMVQEPSKNSQGGGAQDSNGGGAKNNEECGGAAPKVTSAGGSRKSGCDQAVKESKTEEGKPGSGSGGAQPPETVEKNEKGGERDSARVGKVGDGGGSNDANDGGNSGKKKKKKGQNGNSVGGERSSAPQEAPRSQHHEDGPPAESFPDHHSLPRHQSYDHYQPQFYGAPGPQPIAAVSYSTANPASNYTTSYYAPPPPNSYVYSYSGGPEMQPPPLDFDSYPRQPLDSFEIFSDENPNACSIM